jgi:hypothetical protein
VAKHLTAQGWRVLLAVLPAVLAALLVPSGAGMALPHPAPPWGDARPAPAPAPARQHAAEFAARQGVAELMRSAWYWQAHGRADIARTVLEKVLHVRADHAQALLLLGELELRSDRVEPARLMLERLATSHPHTSETAELRQLFTLYSEQRSALEQLRQLRQRGRRAEVLALARRLFPDARPPGALAAEFGPMLGSQADGWERARLYLEQRVARSPAPRDRLALAELEAQRPATRPRALASLARLAGEGQLPTEQIKRSWAGAIELIADAAQASRERQTLARALPGNGGGRPPPVLAGAAAAATTTPAAGTPRAPAGTLAAALPTATSAVADPPAPGARPAHSALDPAADAVLAAVARQARYSAQRVDPYDDGGHAGATGRPSGAAVVPARQADATATAASPAATPTGAATPAAALGPAQTGTPAPSPPAPPADALSAGTPDIGAVRDLADARLAAGRADEARALLDAALEQRPQEVWVRHDLARLLLAQGQPAAARSLMQQGFRHADPAHDDTPLDELPAPGAGHDAPQAVADTHDSELRRAAALVALASDDPDDAVRLLGPSRAGAEPVDAELLDRARFESAALRVRRELAQYQYPPAPRDLLPARAEPGASADTGSYLSTEAAHADEDRLALALQQAADNAGDDPLRLASLARLRSAQARLVQQQSRVEAGLSVGQRRASAGLGELASRETTLLLSADSAGFGPLGPSLREHLPAGRWWAQLDHTVLDAGSLPAAWAQASDFGRVRQLGGPQALPVDLATPLAQRAEGLAAGLGWAAGKQQADLGVVGLGMPVTRWVGGWRWDDWQADGRHLGIEASRRAETGTLLAWAGAVDPVSGQTWGGVTRSALTLRAGLTLLSTGSDAAAAEAAATDQATTDHTVQRPSRSGLAAVLDEISIGTSLRLGRLEGRNVAANSLAQWRGSLELGLLARADVRLSTGLTLDLAAYGANQGNYSWGHGGYYSPQRYAALGLPLALDLRGPGWTAALRASIGRSWTDEDSAPWFPTDAAAQAAAGDPRYRGGPGGGTGGSVRAAAEWQIAPQWRLGASFAMERSSDYAPRRAGIWLRHGLGRQPAQADFPLRAPGSYTRY